jgi:hypothetical protein
VYGRSGHEAGTDVGPMISPAARDRAVDLVNKGIAQGAKVFQSIESEYTSGVDVVFLAPVGWTQRQGSRIPPWQLPWTHHSQRRLHKDGLLHRGDLRTCLGLCYQCDRRNIVSHLLFIFRCA